MTRRVTMREIATAAGVSTATVSRALGIDPRITEATRHHVRAVCETLGYRPNPLLSAYARQRRTATFGAETATLAYLTNFPAPDGWRQNPFYARLFAGAADHASENGYKLEHFWMSEPGMSGERLADILHSRGISGIFIAPTPLIRRLKFDWSRFCCVTVGYSLLEPLLHRTTPHHFQAVLAATARLRARGLERIGFCIHRDTSARVNDLWLAGALLTRQHDPGCPLRIFVYDDASLAQAPEWIAKERLQAVLSDDPQSLRALMNDDLGRASKIEYVTLNWIPNETRGAGVNQRAEAVGAAAIDLLIGLLQRGETGVPRIPVTSMIDCEWIDGTDRALTSDHGDSAPASMATQQAARRAR